MSSWRPKEKELTPEEAIKFAKKERAPYWMVSEPLFAGVDGTLIALDPITEKSDWVIFVTDPTLPSSMRDFAFLHELIQRYQDHDIKFLYVLLPRYPFLKEREKVEEMMRKLNLQLPVCIDSTGELSQALGVTPETKNHPRVVMLSRRAMIHQWSGRSWKVGLEKSVQEFLRKKDPGLPLSPVLSVTDKMIEEKERYDFGRMNSKRMGGLRGVPKGHFNHEDERVLINDPSAEIKFRAQGQELSLFAGPQVKATLYCKIQVELDGVPVPGTFSGTDLAADDDGGVSAKVDGERFYHLLSGLREPFPEVTLRFAWADKASLILYGLSFWKELK
jgi:hypothetical protein